MSKRAVGT